MPLANATRMSSTDFNNAVPTTQFKGASNLGGVTHEVGQLFSKELDLHDMAGNVVQYIMYRGSRVFATLVEKGKRNQIQSVVLKYLSIIV